jgi:hypothetical protein
LFSDDAKFGKKLLEKMGWEDGKGLGATNQGMTDPIMLKSKDDQKVSFLFQLNQIINATKLITFRIINVQSSLKINNSIVRIDILLFSSNYITNEILY